MAKRPWFRDYREKGERSTTAGAHVPVLLDEVLTALNPQSGQTVVDCTLGLAGHAVELLRRVGPTGRLIAFDADPTHIPAADATLAAVGHPFSIYRGNFAGILSALDGFGINHVHGLLADLGMSSMQVDDPGRGFSFMRDGPLDMRMDTTRGRTAADLLQSLSKVELTDAFRELGDEPQAERIATAIVTVRKEKPLATTAELKALILRAAPVTVMKSPGLGPAEKQKMRPTVRVFQTLRMLVNREGDSLRQLLRILPDLLAPNGVAAIISFHSGEDRLVKAAFREGLRNGRYSDGTDEAMRPGEEEKAVNPRSRSAKLRWVRRCK